MDNWWQDRRVFVTGHTGFMGGWLCSYLVMRGAVVHGFALEAPTNPSFFETVGLRDKIANSTIGDVRDLPTLRAAINQTNPEVIFHLAAQPLVLTAFDDPVETFSTNVMGTVNLLEAARDQADLKALLMVTTDKVYKNNNWVWPYRENDALGGKEPYSASKAASECVISAYRDSYFKELGVAALRVGNIIGGGDWAANRLIPDAIRGFAKGDPLVLRNPNATRPWQHVLDPLPGYLVLAERLAKLGAAFSGGWNFGPSQSDCRPVLDVANLLADGWGDGATVKSEPQSKVFEEKLLSLDSSKAISELGWTPRWSLSEALGHVTKWYKAVGKEDMWALTRAQILEFDQKADAP